MYKKKTLDIGSLRDVFMNVQDVNVARSRCHGERPS